MKEASAHAEEDKKRHEVIQAKNNLDTLVYATEKSLKEHGDKVSAEEKRRVEEALTEAKSALTSDAKDKLDAAHQKLTTASHTLAQKMYEEAARKTAGAGGAAGPNPGSGPAGGSAKGPSQEGDNVVDADYEVVDEDEAKKKKG